VNVLVGLTGAPFTVEELGAVRVKRISVGGALARAALASLMRAAREMRERGTFTFSAEAMPFAEVSGYMAETER
jgi:2-methylisocitrate lyase-like PEP mutase family enzyme